MEAATTLRPAHVAVLANRLVVDGLVVDDACAVELVRRRAEAGDDAARVLLDAVEIGARVLDREQAGAHADFVRAEFEKVSREVEQAFSDKARVVAEFFGSKVDEVFGEDHGHRAKARGGDFLDVWRRRWSVTSRTAPRRRSSTRSRTWWTRSCAGRARTSSGSSPRRTRPTRCRSSSGWCWRA